VILDLLGQGTFGQVVKCQNVKTGELVAVKVIKNQPAYLNQSMMEVTVLELLNQKHDPEDRHHLVRMRDTFLFRQHLCIVVELLSLNLYELVKQNQYRGFSLQLCRVFLAQILDAMRVLKEAKLIHCDLKPENILLRNLESPSVKVIDFGSACHEAQTLYTYIQSRFYRSPEVLLGLPYSPAIDMWSLGCIAGELFLGLPIFPGASNYDQVARIVETLGIPPAHMIEVGRDAALYFDKRFPGDGSTPHQYSLKSRDRYALENNRVEPPSKKYFASGDLEEMVLSYPLRPRDMTAAEREAELAHRRLFVDFLRGLLKYNPVERWRPQQALQHPFITGKAPGAGPPSVSPDAPKAYGRPQPVPQQPARQRPRANTLSSASLDVPRPLAKMTSATKAAISGTGGEPPAKPAARQPPPPEEVVGKRGSDTEVLLPFELSAAGMPLERLGKPGQFQPQQYGTQLRSQHPPQPAQQPYQKYSVVDRLYSGGRRQSNPGTIRNNGNGGMRAASIDEYAPSSLPSTSGAWFPSQKLSPPEQGATRQAAPSLHPRGARRRSSDPSVVAAALASAQQPMQHPPQSVQRKGSLSSAVLLPSSLSNSMTLDATMMEAGGSSGIEGDEEDGSSSSSSSSSSTAALSTSSYMDTLEEATEDEDAGGTAYIDVERTSSNNPMDIDG
jgi:serine/threonine protein kinase